MECLFFRLLQTDNYHAQTILIIVSASFTKKKRLCTSKGSYDSAHLSRGPECFLSEINFGAVQVNFSSPVSGCSKTFLGPVCRSHKFPLSFRHIPMLFRKLTAAWKTEKRPEIASSYSMVGVPSLGQSCFWFVRLTVI